MMAFSATGNSNPSTGYSVSVYSERASCDLDFWNDFIYIYTVYIRLPIKMSVSYFSLYFYISL